MNIKNIFNKKTLILLVFDIIIINLAYFLALYLRFDLEFEQIPLGYLNGFRNYAIFNTIITIGIYAIFKLYRIILEYSSYNELIKITQAVILSLLVHIFGISVFFKRMPVSYFIFGWVQKELNLSGQMMLRPIKQCFVRFYFMIVISVIVIIFIVLVLLILLLLLLLFSLLLLLLLLLLILL